MSAIRASSEAEKRKLLTASVRSAITRDLMTTMYTYMPKPDKTFCTKKLVQKYSFMRDVGTNVSGYVSVSIIENYINMYMCAGFMGEKIDRASKQCC